MKNDLKITPYVIPEIIFDDKEPHYITNYIEVVPPFVIDRSLDIFALLHKLINYANELNKRNRELQFITKDLVNYLNNTLQEFQNSINNYFTSLNDEWEKYQTNLNEEYTSFKSDITNKLNTYQKNLTDEFNSKYEELVESNTNAQSAYQQEVDENLSNAITEINNLIESTKTDLNNILNSTNMTEKVYEAIENNLSDVIDSITGSIIRLYSMSTNPIQVTNSTPLLNYNPNTYELIDVTTMTPVAWQMNSIYYYQNKIYIPKNATPTLTQLVATDYKIKGYSEDRTKVIYGTDTHLTFYLDMKTNSIINFLDNINVGDAPYNCTMNNEGTILYYPLNNNIYKVSLPDLTSTNIYATSTYSVILNNDRLFAWRSAGFYQYDKDLNFVKEIAIPYITNYGLEENLINIQGVPYLMRNKNVFNINTETSLNLFSSYAKYPKYINKDTGYVLNYNMLYVINSTAEYSYNFGSNAKYGVFSTHNSIYVIYNDKIEEYTIPAMNNAPILLNTYPLSVNMNINNVNSYMNKVFVSRYTPDNITAISLNNELAQIQMGA